MAKRASIRLLSVGDEVVVHQLDDDGLIDVNSAQASTISQVCGDFVMIRYMSYQGPRQWMVASFNNVETSKQYKQGPSNDRGRPVYFFEP